MKEIIIKYKYQIIGVLVIVALWGAAHILVNENAKLKKKLAVAEHNVKVANDSIRLVKDKLGRDEYDKLAYLTNSVKNLEKLNSELAEEVRAIKGNVNTIIKSDIKIVEKPVPFEVRAELVDSTLTAFFNYDSTYSPGNYKKLSGYTQYNLKDGTVVAKKITDEVGISFTTGIKGMEEGKPEIFLKSNYPGFSVTNLDGAVLDPKLFKPKNKTPLMTPTLAVGWTPLTYDNKEQIVRVSPRNIGVTAGVGFNVFKLLGIKK